ncbi:bifunctional phosphoribosyl-AMP cyclohydrolase/phosphoribosyl-ATP diphosphatase HisIE [Helicobacter canis]|uniref:Histidine biosynthesis bifunctional protein HisIE n=1 Tax=Helicobacter canis TaxID=29419 RepID=A0A5M9QQY3_9HELI|nr:bifunctional phosphoribosyl-AMP cyclohydrolase/phosphoribosyl-ATP diphosphatase HisIE [Helicobacter canis]KAA8710768.1 bifunctional phosphoribosyl-AMP cyclohydrolase/phosphoribosyl-ATP diphosphatase HisIE [Helicobacter canis]
MADYIAASGELADKLDWDKSPLIPAVVQDSSTKEVLMLAFMDKQALQLTLESGYMHYFSRSKNRIWKKGERSGHTQKVESIALDCDNDALLFSITQVGAACHTGHKSCFFHKLDSSSAKELESTFSMDSACALESKTLESNALDSSPKAHASDLSQAYDIMDTLYHTLLERKSAPESSSYTASLYAKGVNGFGKKIIEEAGEVLLALKDKDSGQIVYECADLLYHILVGLAYYNIHPEQVLAELQRRLGLSGLEEKARRGQ